MKSIKYRDASQGFVGMVFLAIALIGIVIGAISSMSRASSTNTATEADKTAASALMKQSADIKTAFDILVVDPGLLAPSITFDSANSTGLFSPVFKVAVRPRPPAASIDAALANSTFTYNRRAIIPGVGASNRNDFVMALGGVRLSVCRAINRSLYNDALTATPATSSAPFSAWSSPGTDTDIDDSSVSASNYIGRPEGCIATSDGLYVYYKVLAEDAQLAGGAGGAGGGGMGGMGGSNDPMIGNDSGGFNVGSCDIENDSCTMDGEPIEPGGTEI